MRARPDGLTERSASGDSAEAAWWQTAAVLTKEPEPGLTSSADARGRWALPQLKALRNAGPFELALSCGGATETARDVWFG